ncbi:bifunctional demethylmenaquinone methyltransferase/2-methoxy-6-polyprenyl-1,4-benzoquinol methylase UbiE [Planctomicrobium piriforme]|uniref:Demethylmenaquinone methyltransferase n=1 Tax=Planctomicrobium piriforme TaxID=1576369 RepID=A0A1I3BES3_9PLAN|nr:bifunctional demethylmenaquinone methyltransferase/2-methoxy-6-polyprenyl-1,4-benzoquinol methylase UbiE [Planctomicrobium piriforme]SFH60783.1 demethylmenaquinone methyltransferase / 2-methoxy-6-polyprenyl-1,4-benzoquinol methylase [Planctomicrobium piriforme]
MNSTAPVIETPASVAPVDKSGDRVKKMFGEISKRYDLMNHLLSGGVDIYWRSYTVRQVAPQGDAPILDVCTGTGDLALAYWNKTGRKLSVVGTDFTPEMLTIARQKSQRYETGATGSIEFIEADTQQLPFPDDQFQIVSVAFGLRNVNDTRAGLIEMRRVCQPGGRVAILEFSQPTMPGLAGFYRWYFKNILPRIGQLFASNREDAYNYLPQSVSQFPCGQALADIMQDCGLKNVTFTPLTFGIATLYVGTK